MNLAYQTAHTNIKKRKTLSNGTKLLLLILPLVLFVFAFSYVPLFGWVYAFFDYKPGIPLSQTPFVGLKYFLRMLQDGGEMIKVLRNTFVMSFLSILSTPMPIILAIMINEVNGNKFKKLVQTMTTMPYFISWIILFGLSFGIFSSEGVLNSLLKLVGAEPIPSPGILGNSSLAWGFQWALGMWKYLGWNAIIYLATIAGIDSELYDAAKVDGANRFQTTLNITLPGLYSTYFVLLLLGISSMLSNGFDQYFIFMNPMVSDKLNVLDYYVYKIGLLANNYPYSTAIGMAKTIISVSLLFMANAISKPIRGESII